MERGRLRTTVAPALKFLFVLARSLYPIRSRSFVSRPEFAPSSPPPPPPVRGRSCVLAMCHRLFSPPRLYMYVYIYIYIHIYTRCYPLHASSGWGVSREALTLGVGCGRSKFPSLMRAFLSLSLSRSFTLSLLRSLAALRNTHTPARASWGCGILLARNANEIYN